jgi:hypothetical protein
MRTIFREEKRTVEIDDARGLRHENCRRNR